MISVRRLKPEHLRVSTIDSFKLVAETFPLPFFAVLEIGLHLLDWSEVKLCRKRRGYLKGVEFKWEKTGEKLLDFLFAKDCFVCMLGADLEGDIKAGGVHYHSLCAVFWLHISIPWNIMIIRKIHNDIKLGYNIVWLMLEFKFTYKVDGWKV